MPSTSIHGTPDYAELAALGLQPQDLTYFSSNINPYGPPDSVVEAVRAYISREALSRYPDSLNLALREKLASHHNLPQDAFLVGNGTADLIWLICHRYAADGKQAVILSPTFSEYADGVVMAGGHPTHIVLPGWQRIGPNRYVPGPISFEQTCNALRAASPWIVFLCNPNNPTGEYFTPQQVRTLHQAAPRALWIVDEAYAAFTDQPWSAGQWVMEDGWIVLHSMTKDFALGALRLGYLIASPRIVAELQGVQPPWNVNGLAQFAGRLALDELTWRQQTLAQLRKETYTTRLHLQRMGYAPRETSTNYFLLPVGDGAAMRSRLLTQRLAVRDCASFGLPEYIRIAVQQPEANERLLAALEG
jgi:histidinol-phosphate aminotransferase